MTSLAIVSPLNKRTVRGNFNLRLQYDEDMQDKDLLVYVNDELFAQFPFSEKVQIENLPEGIVKLTAAVMTDSGLITSDAIEIYSIQQVKKEEVAHLEEDNKDDQKSKSEYYSLQKTEHNDEESASEQVAENEEEDNKFSEENPKSKVRAVKKESLFVENEDEDDDDFISNKEELSARSGWGDEPSGTLSCKVAGLKGCGCGGKNPAGTSGGPNHLTAALSCDRQDRKGPLGGENLKGCGCGGKNPAGTSGPQGASLGPDHLTYPTKYNNESVQVVSCGSTISPSTTNLIITKLDKEDNDFLLPLYKDKGDHSLTVVNYSSVIANLIVQGKNKIYLSGNSHYISADSTQRFVYKAGVWYPN